MDISDTLRAKSDQMNADDLVGGPITVQVERVTEGSAEQPVVVHVTGGHQPWRPSKTSRRVLARAWGTHTERWVGRWMVLFRDPDVLWAGKPVGGIRIQALSHIDHPISVTLQVSRSKKETRRIEALTPPKPITWAGVLEDHGLTDAQVDAWRAAHNKGPVSGMTDEGRQRFAAWLSERPAMIAQIKGAE